MVEDAESRPTTHNPRIPTPRINKNDELPGPHRILSTRILPLSSTHLHPDRSHLNLLIDQRFSKSSQRRRRNFLQDHPPGLFFFTCALLIFLLFACLMPPVRAADAGETITLSRTLNDLSEEAVETKTLPRPPPLASQISGSISDFEGLELSDDLEVPVNTDEDEQDESLAAERLEFQSETILVGDYSRISRNEDYIKDLVIEGTAQAYSDGVHIEFKNLLYVSNENALYAVAKDATLIKLDGRKLTLIDSYDVPPLPQTSIYCQESKGCKQHKEINLLARTPEKPFIFYCSLHYEAYPRGINRQALTNCAVPNPRNLAENLLIWDNAYYTSMDPYRPPVVLTPEKSMQEQSLISTPHQPFLYVAGVTANFLHIGRLQMPDWSSGDIHWDGALFSPKRNTFINEPATIVMSFETEDSVYFLLREKPSSTSRQEPPRQVVSRLVRVCRGDRGGLPGIAEHYFGTTAKADLLCQSERSRVSAVGVRNYFAFDFAQAAHWDPDANRLYVVFSAGVAAPLGSAICVYDLEGIERVFRGPISTSHYYHKRTSNPVENNARSNPFPNICERFKAGNLTADELSLSHIGATFLYRYEPVSPLFGHAVAMSASMTWTTVIGYRLPTLTNARYTTSILWVSSSDYLTQLAIYEGHEKKNDLDKPVLWSTCELRSLRVSQHNDILERLRNGPRTTSKFPNSSFKEEESWQGNYITLPEESTNEHIHSVIREGDSIILGTTGAIFRFSTDTCASYSTKEECLSSGDPHCAWHSQAVRCVSLLNLQRFQTSAISLAANVNTRPRCPPHDLLHVTQDSGWSPWHSCSMIGDFHPKINKTVSEIQRSCLCRICLSETLCNFGEQQVSKCKIPGVWSPWSSWSRCQDRLRFRTRTCFNPLLGSGIPSSDCLGAEREEQFCLIHPLIPEEVALEGMHAEHVALEESSTGEITIDRKYLVGILIGLFVGILCTLLFIFLIICFCRPLRQRFIPITTHPLRSRLHVERLRMNDVQLQNQLRLSLLNDHPMYANPSPVDQSILSSSSARYNFLLQPSALQRTGRFPESMLPSVDETSTTVGFYDRLSEDNK